MNGWAFRNLHIGAILLPNSIKVIGREALSYTGLEDLFLPPGIENLDLPAGTGIGSLHIPGSVKRMSACCWSHMPKNLSISVDDDFSPKYAGYYEVANISISANQARLKYVDGLVYDTEVEEVVCYNMDEQKKKVIVPRVDA